MTIDTNENRQAGRSHVDPTSIGGRMWPEVTPSFSSFSTTETDIQAVIQRAGHLNKEGINKMVSGQVDLGIYSFRSALELLEQTKLFLVVSNQAHNSTSNIEAHGTNLFGAGGPLLGAVGLPSMLRSHENEFIYLYDNVLDFLPDLQGRLSMQENTLLLVYFYSAVIMFNIGVCLHLHGMPRNEDGILVAAVHFYDMSMQIIASIPILEYSDKLMMIMLSIWNNQSQIYYQLGSYDHAVEVLEGVRSLSARLLFERRTTLDPVDQEHIHEFVLNVVTVHIPTTAPSA